MSSKRGRKRNDNLPPNRARDVQRAFRARRAAHLQALEQRVSELEEENACLRRELNLPPANRPPLGKGPTGKDKPKSLESNPHPHQLPTTNHDSSSVDSPSSTRANSLSPSDITASLRTAPRTVHMIDSGGNWEQSLLMHDQPFDSQLSGSSTSAYQLPPTPSVPSKIQYSAYANSVPPPTRNSVSNVMFMAQANHPHSTDRTMGGAYSPGFMMRNDVRHDAQTPSLPPPPLHAQPPQQQQQQQQPQHQHPPQPQPQPYAYSQQSFLTAHDTPLHTQSHSPGTPLLSQSQVQRDGSLPYPHRRSLTDPQGFRTQFPHLPNPVHGGISHGIRLPSPPRLQDGGSPSSRAVYGNDGRINLIS